MGNAGSSNMPRERHKFSEFSSTPNSPFRELSIRENDSTGGVNDNDVTTGVAVDVAFNFDNKYNTMQGGSSQEDDESTYEPYYTKPIGQNTQQQQYEQKCTTIIDPACEFDTTQTRKRSSTEEESEEMATTAETDVNIEVEKKSVSEQISNEGDGARDNNNGKVEQLSTFSNNTPPTLPTVLRWNGGGNNVMISGTFTKWKPVPMVRSHGNFVTIIDLPEGDHQYKFCVDGEWCHDPKMKNVENENGDTINLVTVRQSDFEVFQALAKDGEQSVSQSEKEYSQEVPQIKPWEKLSGPPILPPHLLQVILNKDTPLSCEPTLLPEPNHVMLNHLYALSIKDGVMVLSATHRYRKKYVTTLLYKPI